MTLPHKLPNDLPLRLKILGNLKTSYNYILLQKYAEKWKLNFPALFHITTWEFVSDILSMVVPTKTSSVPKLEITTYCVDFLLIVF